MLKSKNLFSVEKMLTVFPFCSQEKEKEELMKLRIQNKIQQRTMAQRKNAMRKKYAPTIFQNLVQDGMQNI